MVGRKGKVLISKRCYISNCINFNAQDPGPTIEDLELRIEDPGLRVETQDLASVTNV